jgi:hypothetical protein
MCRCHRRVLRSRIAAAWRGVGPMRSTGGPCAPVYRLFSPPRVEGAGGLAGWSVTKPPVRPEKRLFLGALKKKHVTLVSLVGLSQNSAKKWRFCCYHFRTFRYLSRLAFPGLHTYLATSPGEGLRDVALHSFPIKS